MIDRFEQLRLVRRSSETERVCPRCQNFFRRAYPSPQMTTGTRLRWRDHKGVLRGVDVPEAILPFVEVFGFDKAGRFVQRFGGTTVNLPAKSRAGDDTRSGMTIQTLQALVAKFGAGPLTIPADIAFWARTYWLGGADFTTLAVMTKLLSTGLAAVLEGGGTKPARRKRPCGAYVFPRLKLKLLRCCLPPIRMIDFSGGDDESEDGVDVMVRANSRGFYLCRRLMLAKMVAPLRLAVPLQKRAASR